MGISSDRDTMGIWWDIQKTRNQWSCQPHQRPKSHLKGLKSLHCNGNHWPGCLGTPTGEGSVASGEFSPRIEVPSGCLTWPWRMASLEMIYDVFPDFTYEIPWNMLISRSKLLNYQRVIRCAAGSIRKLLWSSPSPSGSIVLFPCALC